MSRPRLRLGGAEDGPTALFVHGTMDVGGSFRRVGEVLSGWRVAHYDRRGWGESRELADPDTGITDHVADLIALLSEVRDPVLVGHSYGGYVALCAAAERPDLVRAVLAYEPPVPWLPWWPAVTPWERAVKEAAPDGPVAVATAMHRAVVGRAPAGDEERLAADGEMLLREMSDSGLDNQAFDPLDFPVPALLASGTASPPHHRTTGRGFAELVPRGRYEEIFGANHIAHVTHAKVFARLVEMSGTAAEWDT